MIGFVEHKVDLRWPVSVAPPPYSKPSQPLGLVWEPKTALGMWNDAFFPPIPPHSSPLLSGYPESNESRSPSSSSSMRPEMEGVRYNGGIFLPSQDSYMTQTSSSSLVPLVVTTGGLSSSLINYIPGYRDDLMATTAINPGISNSTPSHSDAVANSRKHQLAEDKARRKAIAVQETKKQKIIQEEKFHFPPSADHPTAPQRQIVKAPVRRSQKLGDKITALQQLVSPYGKTDTASVLHEAGVYIKVLHDQIRALTALYHPTKSSNNQLGLREASTNIRGRGLCLVPVSSPLIDLADQAFLGCHLQDSKP